MTKSYGSGNTTLCAEFFDSDVALLEAFAHSLQRAECGFKVVGVRLTSSRVLGFLFSTLLTAMLALLTTRWAS